jgi:RNA-directed DNA polymerase
VRALGGELRAPREGQSTRLGEASACHRAARAQAQVRPVGAASLVFPAPRLRRGAAGAQWLPARGTRQGGGDGQCVVSSFDAIDHGWLIKFVEHRIGDQRLVRLIQKWLRAGVMVDGERTECDRGTPQGSTISPLLANLYLHYVFDLWALQWRRRRAHGDMVIVRYADDIVVGFQHEREAKQFLCDLQHRMRQFALELHPDKTRLRRFGRLAFRDWQSGRGDKPETFNFLGFTHMCGKSRKGKFLLTRRTMRRRMEAKLRDIRMELRRRMHQPVIEQGKWLQSVVRGFFAYHAVPTNSHRLGKFRLEVIRAWHWTLRRRSQHDRMTRGRIRTLARRWIPPNRVQHPWPSERFGVWTQGRSPVR